MIKEQFQRNVWAIGEQKQKELQYKSVLVIGLGGVGGPVVELLARAGVGTIGICDGDVVDATNINRQLIANHKTIGMYKTDLWEQRAKEINPNIKIIKHTKRYNEVTRGEILADKYDYVVDAFDQYIQKVDLMIACSVRKIKAIHSMGAANRFDPTKFKIGKLEDVNGDFLAKMCKAELKKHNKKASTIKVVYSTEHPMKSNPPASLSFTPMASGNIIAFQVFKELAK